MGVQKLFSKIVDRGKGVSTIFWPSREGGTYGGPKVQSLFSTRFSLLENRGCREEKRREIVLWGHCRYLCRSPPPPPPSFSPSLVASWTPYRAHCGVSPRPSQGVALQDDKYPNNVRPPCPLVIVINSFSRRTTDIVLTKNEEDKR